MQFHTKRLNDQSSFTALMAHPSATPITCFGMRILKLSYDPMPDAYADDLLLRTPELADTPHNYFFAATSAGKELFAIVTLTDIASRKGAFAVQVPHFVLYMPPVGLLMPSGRVVEMSPSPELLLPDDGAAVSYQLVDAQSQQYFAVREGFASTSLPTPPHSEALTSSQQVDAHLANILTPACPTSGAPIYVEIGCAGHGRVYANVNPGLMHLAGLDRS